MALPPFRTDGWLPEGHWRAERDEVVSVLGGRAHSRRAELTGQLLQWRDSVRAKGLAGRLVLNGSYASTKAEPGDIDAIFVFDGDSEAILKRDPEAQNLVNYLRVKESGFGDLFIYAESTVREYPQWCRLDGFDYDRDSGERKGVIEVAI